MKRNHWIILLMILIIFVACGTSFTTTVAAEENQDWLEFISFDSFQSTGYDLSLPEDGYKEFSGDAQQELLSIASLYDNGNVERQEISLNGEEKEVETLLLNPVPGMELEANYGETMEELAIERWTNVDLEYSLNDRTSIRAGYGMLSRESMVEELLGEGETPDHNDEELIPFYTYDRQMTGQGKVGISYQTTDKITLSADYMQNLVDGDSAVFGVIYRDEQGEIKASYQIDQQSDSKETITGLELAVPNMATFSASYKLINPAELEQQLSGEKIWDFGVNVNLNEISSLSLDYQLKDNETNDENEEASVKASFKIDF